MKLNKHLTIKIIGSSWKLCTPEKIKICSGINTCFSYRVRFIVKRHLLIVKFSITTVIRKVKKRCTLSRILNFLIRLISKTNISSITPFPCCFWTMKQDFLTKVHRYLYVFCWKVLFICSEAIGKRCNCYPDVIFNLSRIKFKYIQG